MIFPPGSFQGPKVDTKKALLLLDLQNDFLTPTGSLPVANTSSFVPRLPSLIAKFREQGQIVFVQTVYRQPCPVLSPYTGGYNIMLKTLADYMRRHPRRGESTTTDPARDDDETATQLDLPLEPDLEAFLDASLPPNAQRCCLPNTKGYELSPRIASCVDKQKDMVLVKSEYSLFTNPLVVMQLRARLISDLYICGSLSNISVYATVLDAVQQGFNVTLIEDCLGFRDGTCHVEAIRQMADDFGANGIDYSELMDDLHGLLGDVVPASRYTRTFQLSMQAQDVTQVSSTQRVNQWMDTIEAEPDEPEAKLEPTRSVERIPTSQAAAAKVAAPLPHDSSAQALNSRASSAPSPPRKRSTSDRDDNNGNQTPRLSFSQETSAPTSPAESSGRPTLKKTRRESNTSKTSKDSASGHPLYQPTSLGAIGQSQSTGQLETSRTTSRSPKSPGRTMSQPEPIQAHQPTHPPSKRKKSKHKFDPTYLGPDDTIGESDSRIIHDVLSAQDANEAFSQLKYDTAWQKMYHRTGEVPRLVAVQGIVAQDGTIPIYRHPADESPPLQPFDETVNRLRKYCEKLVKHPLNHVLIQYYRNGEDNISEHSDKTLDIIRGSSIVNLSLGAMRTMTLRTKKVSRCIDTEDSAGSNATVVESQPRTTRRIRLPHNSLFVLGERTNANWLHAIKADKRLGSEKSHDELSFGGERISLTFRNIGTFIDPKTQTIWGQGATCKTKTGARKILTGREAEIFGERMIIGFGKENHLNDSEFDWQEVYGSGFDVVNFEIKANGD